MRLNRRKFLRISIGVARALKPQVFCRYFGAFGDDEPTLISFDPFAYYPSRRWEEKYRGEPGLSPYGFSYYAPGLGELPLTWRQYWRCQHVTNRRKHDTRRNRQGD